MKIDYIVNQNANTETLVLMPELEAEKLQLENLCKFMNIEWNYRDLVIKLK